MDLQLTGRTALVTGGTRGIGRAIVAGFLDEGANVCFCARTTADVEATESVPPWTWETVRRSRHG